MLPDLSAAVRAADDRTLDRILFVHLFGFPAEWFHDDDAGRDIDLGGSLGVTRILRTPSYCLTGAEPVIEAMRATPSGYVVTVSRGLTWSCTVRHHGNAVGRASADTFSRAVAEAAVLALAAADALPADALALLPA